MNEPGTQGEGGGCGVGALPLFSIVAVIAAVRLQTARRRHGGADYTSHSVTRPEDAISLVEVRSLFSRFY